MGRILKNICTAASMHVGDFTISRMEPYSAAIKYSFMYVSIAYMHTERIFKENSL